MLAEEKAPLFINGSKLIDAEGLIKLAQQYEKLVLVDSRIASDRQHGYIEQSISLPDIDTTCFTLTGTIGSKTTPVAFYCNGPKCGRSVNAVKIAQSCGYADIYWFRGGYEEWTSKEFPVVVD